ncbi:MAG: aldolase/citrate lyase family protein [Thaumarchaeota archaeon]|nr:aldolase/citrate lyase family protein [Nitrososphaerota archaeon]
MRENTVKQKLARNELTLGTWITINNPDVAEIIAWSGFDWMILDMEHAPVDVPGISLMAQAVSSAPTLPIVRVPWNDPVYVKRALDLGVSGVMIPYVNDKREATIAARSAKYPPTGTRGAGPRRASMYGMDWDDYLSKANDSLLVVLQVESVEAVNNVEDILSVEGIDVLFVGPLDLSFSAGFPSKTDRPEVQALIRRVAEAAESAGVKSGIDSPTEQVKHYADMGMKFIATGGDTNFLLDGAKAAVAAKDKVVKST